MGLYRKIDTDFWDDEKVVEDFTKEDILVFIHLLSSDKSNLCGCYKITVKTIARKTKCTLEETKQSIDHLTGLGVINYDAKTQEVLLVNYPRHSWTCSPKFRKGVEKELEQVKSEKFKDFILDNLGKLPTREKTEKTVRSKNQFNNYPQNKYDMEQLEKEVIANK